MKVYTHYLNKNEKEYRWRTILQIGDSWEVRGTIFMKNPGSSINLNENSVPIKDDGILDNLRKFDDTKNSFSNDWYEFTIDKTMACVKELFETYYCAHKESLNGVIQIFNLFNIRDANLGKAIDKSKGDIIDELVYTTDDDVKHIVSPVYVGWGNLWRNPKHRTNAEKIISEIIKKTTYLSGDVQKNRYYHPLFLMRYGKNKENCKKCLDKFLSQNSQSTKET